MYTFRCVHFIQPYSCQEFVITQIKAKVSKKKIKERKKDRQADSSSVSIGVCGNIASGPFLCWSAVFQVTGSVSLSQTLESRCCGGGHRHFTTWGVFLSSLQLHPPSYWSTTDILFVFWSCFDIAPQPVSVKKPGGSIMLMEVKVNITLVYQFSLLSWIISFFGLALFPAAVLFIEAYNL